MQIAMHVCFSNFAFNFGNVNHKTGKKKKWSLFPHVDIIAPSYGIP